MELTVEEIDILLAGAFRLETAYRKKENDRHGEPITELRKLDRIRLKNIQNVQDKLVLHKSSLVIAMRNKV